MVYRINARTPIIVADFTNARRFKGTYSHNISNTTSESAANGSSSSRGWRLESAWIKTDLLQERNDLQFSSAIKLLRNKAYPFIREQKIAVGLCTDWSGRNVFSSLSWQQQWPGVLSI